MLAADSRSDNRKDSSLSRSLFPIALPFLFRPKMNSISSDIARADGSPFFSPVSDERASGDIPYAAASGLMTLLMIARADWDCNVRVD